MTDLIETMPKKHMGGPSFERIWLQQQFEKLHREHAVILSKLGGGVVTPELEKEIYRAMKLSKTIDEKVPDINVPPSAGKP